MATEGGAKQWLQREGLQREGLEGGAEQWLQREGLNSGYRGRG